MTSPRVKARMKRRNRRGEKERFLNRMRALMPGYSLAGFAHGCPVWVSNEGTWPAYEFGWPSKKVWTVTVTRSRDPVEEFVEVGL